MQTVGDPSAPIPGQARVAEANSPAASSPNENAAAAAASSNVADIPAATLVYLTPIGEFIHSADGKAGTILTVLGIMFTLLARFGGPLDAMLRGGNRPLMVLTIALLAGFALAALAAVVQAFRTISPRFPKATPSLAFFGDIATLAAEQYHARAAQLGADQALAERMKYNHTGARIIIVKMAQMRRALRCFEVAAVCWLLLATILTCRAFLA